MLTNGMQSFAAYSGHRETGCENDSVASAAGVAGVTGEPTFDYRSPHRIGGVSPHRCEKSSEGPVPTDDNNHRRGQTPPMRSRAASTRACVGGLSRVVSRAVAVLVMCALAVLLASCASSAEMPTVKESVNEYSWSELSAISNQIAAAASDDGARAIAVNYHLAAADGTLDGTQAKDVELADGTRTRAIVAGFRHDDAAAGGRAGVTFVFEDAVANRPMNNNAGFDELDDDDDLNTFGGWNACELRGWLNGDFLDELPSDLRAQLVRVVKTSCVISGYELPFGSDYTAESVLSESVDSVWLPAVVELSGVADGTKRAEEDPDRVDILRKEGAQLQLFADLGIVEQDGFGNESLVRHLADGKPCGWWLRSTEFNSFAHVNADGAIDRTKHNSGNPLGVVPCFAL